MSRSERVGEVAIEMHGITGGDDYYVVYEAQEAVENALKRQLAKGATEKELKKIGRDALLNLLWERTKQRPMAVASILSV